MQSTLSFLALLVSAVSAVPDTRSFSLVADTFPDFSACLSQPSVYSCENTTQIANTCCSPTPGGLVLQTQFWSTWTGLEKQGQRLPKGSWTIHGLWPDNCDGSFAQYCDASRQYDPAPAAGVTPYTGPGVDSFILEFGRVDLLDYMSKYWINQGAPNKDFWAHEFSKHATCTSTFDVACYGSSYKEHQDVINFFDAVIRAFHQYPTYDLLAAGGIVPSNKTTYSLSQIQNTLKAQTAALPYLGCTHNGTVLTEVWYFSHVYGTEQYGTYKTLDTTTASTCSSTLPIWYYERTPASEHEVRTLP
ncbi:ribonuclease T2-like protein [Mycena albidolilacea]|uniref:ribonuclease T2 n=1 Tax=Mycena albidolilacea TaxID=1033008 RepID=A0AAD7F1I8_9AGAR|nr:ribonuclease T2-like protein [Mycena albidolilacea]